MKIHIQFKKKCPATAIRVQLITSYIHLEYFTEFGI